ncbi:hypothetical protein KMW28_12665 [Flammeovirga yaeyamensis]|uniref:Uncharacterized protein n=1 Tax=Flammeovirga yaeyamensis TaxID=367791 RepID=A0AAX1MZ36_9BACT|nr:hypothetical protein [Flammeovirga yaeyamensis]MBB3695979.1 hypothetical protein [Flammeovirga yaeyamensis]NMF34665.1 hypothetical protein [Flammeovirga yaeyamensis]QWG00505.1 hypothetical protein KMW28_12665 [Flammeovirga yaeyamensis]
MKTILKSIQSLKKNEWFYYNQTSKNKLKNPFNNDDENNQTLHLNFIKDFFTSGGKLRVLDDLDIEDFKNNDYVKHTNSVYFLGILIFSQWKLNLSKDEFILRLNEREGFDINRFQFMWFLSTLFHDLYYKYEEVEEIKRLKEQNIFTYSDLERYFYINYTIEEDFNENPIPEILSDNISNYVIWKLEKRGKYDHGIIAGMKLFDELKKNRIEVYQNRYENLGLNWESKLDIQYYYCAQIIKAHNIWFNPGKDQNYADYGMEGLEINPNIKFQEYPFYYLFCLIDTIDPVKALKNEIPNVNDILDSILIEISKDSLILKNDKLEETQFDNIKKKCFGLKEWLDIMVSATETTINISIPKL